MTSPARGANALFCDRPEAAGFPSAPYVVIDSGAVTPPSLSYSAPALLPKSNRVVPTPDGDVTTSMGPRIESGCL